MAVLWTTVSAGELSSVEGENAAATTKPASSLAKQLSGRTAGKWYYYSAFTRVKLMAATDKYLWFGNSGVFYYDLKTRKATAISPLQGTSFDQVKPKCISPSSDGRFVFHNGWSNYLIASTFTIGTKVSTLPVFLNRFSGDTSLASWNTVAALGLFTMIPVMIFFIFTQESLLSIYGGGSKGGA